MQNSFLVHLVQKRIQIDDQDLRLRLAEIVAKSLLPRFLGGEISLNVYNKHTVRASWTSPASTTATSAGGRLTYTAVLASASLHITNTWMAVRSYVGLLDCVQNGPENVSIYVLLWL